MMIRRGATIASEPKIRAMSCSAMTPLTSPGYSPPRIFLKTMAMIVFFSGRGVFMETKPKGALVSDSDTTFPSFTISTFRDPCSVSFLKKQIATTPFPLYSAGAVPLTFTGDGRLSPTTIA